MCFLLSVQKFLMKNHTEGNKHGFIKKKNRKNYHHINFYHLNGERQDSFKNMCEICDKNIK